MTSKIINEYSAYSLSEGPLKVQRTQIIHGANYFSAGPIIKIRLDLGPFHEIFTNTIDGFPDKLKQTLPSLMQHHCSVGKEGGFFLRVYEGTLLGHVIEHVAIELQTLAGMDVCYGKTRSTLEPGVYNIIFRFFDEVAGLYAGKAAVNLVNALLKNESIDCDEIVRNLTDIREKRLLGASMQAIVSECEKRNIPWQRIDAYNLVQLGTGKFHKMIRATITSDTNFISVETADNNYLTSLILKDSGIPVLQTLKTEIIECDTAKHLVDMLFPNNTRYRVPVFSVTGSAGKTIAVSLLNHCLTNEGYSTGVLTSDGIFISGKNIIRSRSVDSANVSLILSDPGIDCAILETSKESILRDGLGYKFADYGIVLNIHDEHLGTDDIKFIEDLAYAKSVVAEEIYEDGFTILNADYKLVMEMSKRLYSKLVLFSAKPGNPEIQLHVSKGGLAVNITDESIFILRNNTKEKVIELKDVPLTFEGKAEFVFEDILAVVATLAAHGLSAVKIASHLSSFNPNSEVQGRLNFFDVKGFKILLDNAHNHINFAGLKKFLSNYPEKKLGVLDAAGDRSNEEITMLATIAASTYDELFFYEGIDNRGRPDGQIIELLKNGAIQTGFDAAKITTFLNPAEAWTKALQNGEQGKMIVILSATPDETIKVIEQFRTS